MTSRIRRIGKLAFAGLDLLHRPLAGPRILIYHQIGGGSGLEMEVGSQDFVSQLDWIAERYPVVELDHALAYPKEDTVVLTFDDGYASVYQKAFPELLRRDLPFTLYLTTQPIESGQPLRDHPGADPLKWPMIEEMVDSGLLTVGAHTHTHPDLRTESMERIRSEIETSNRIIGERLGVRPDHFTYPWGYWSEEAHTVISQSYRSATVGGALPGRISTDPHIRHRIPVQLSDGYRWFPARMRRGLMFEESVRRRIRRYTGP